jgi:hypothetical protein
MKLRTIITVTTLGLLLGFALWSAGLGAKAKGTAAAPAVMPPTMQPRINLMATPCSNTSFTQPIGSPFGGVFTTYSVAAGDFNLDGKPDLAAANLMTNNVTILLGNGTGGFTQAVGSPVGAGRGPASVAVGDFNQDGKLDLAVANELSSNVTILLGNGAGGFTQPAGSPVGVGSGPRSVAVGDFNLDGKPDLATANEQTNNVTILLGNGAGGFTQPAGSPVGAGEIPLSVAVGDFNLDGKPDLAAANYDSFNVTILLGNGTGGFTQAAGSPVSTGSGSNSVAVGDFNVDGKPDLAVSNARDDNVTILLGNGAGGFTQPAGSPVGAGDFPTSVAVGDFNLDGASDLAVSNAVSDNVTVLLGNGAGGFTQPAGSPVGVGRTPYSVAVGDFNLDGMSDFAAANYGSSNVTILLNTCTSNNPPRAVCQNVTLPVGAGCAVSLTAAQVDGGSSDPDGDSISLSLDSYGPFGLGSHTVTLTVTDSNGASSSCTATVTVVDNTAPTITLQGANPMTVECPYSFVDPGAAASDNCAGSVAVTTSGSVNTAVPGSYTITYSANDGRGNTATRTRTVNVVDTAAPTLTLKPDIQLWPPNHKYQTLTMSQMVQSVSDGCNAALSLNDVRIEKVTSDEPDNAPGDADGNTTNDILIAADCKSVQLRSERDETKNGRVYVVTLRLRDASGNTTRKDFKAPVPIGQNGVAAVQDAAAQTKTSSCP